MISRASNELEKDWLNKLVPSRKDDQTKNEGRFLCKSTIHFLQEEDSFNSIIMLFIHGSVIDTTYEDVLEKKNMR